MPAQVGQHDYRSASHLPLDASLEPPIESTLPGNYLAAVRRFGAEPFLAHRAGLTTDPWLLRDEYAFVSYAHSAAHVRALAELLLGAGLRRGDRCLLYARNSPAWLLLDLAVAFAGGVLAPVYDTLGVDNIAHCARAVGARFVLVSREYLPNVVGALGLLADAELLVCLDEPHDAAALWQRAARVHAQLGQGPVEADDAGSMYSISLGGAAAAGEPGEAEAPPGASVSCADGFVEIGGARKRISFGLPLAAPTDAEAAEALRWLEARLAELRLGPDDVSAVIFTSGTSGRPKAVLATHANVISGGACLGRQFVPYHAADAGGQNSMLSYLPLAHVFERNMEHLCIYRGHCIYYSSGNIRNLTRDMQLSRTTLMIGVPRVYCKIHQAIMEKLARAGPAARAVFWGAYSLKKLYLRLRPGAYRTGRMPGVDLVFKKIADALGGRMEFLVSGSSALPAEVKEFLEVTTGARLSVGYGLTEASATGLYNYCGQHFNMPTQLGLMCWRTEGKLVDASDRSEFRLEDGVGELCIRGPGVVRERLDGSWDARVSTVDADGFYHTGDLVRLHADGSVSFLRRVGLVVKLQQGEFVDLEAVEAALEASPTVQAAVVHAEPDKSAPVALLSVDACALSAALGGELGARMSRAANGDKKLSKQDQEALERYFLEEGSRVVRAAGLKGFNVPRAYHVELNADWATDPALYTPTQKKRHAGFAQRYAAELAALWAAVATREVSGKGAAAAPKRRGGPLWAVAALGAVFLAAVVLRVR